MNAQPARTPGSSNAEGVHTPSIRQSRSEALAFFADEGYLVEEGLVPPERRQQLIDLALSMPNAKDGSFRPIPMPHFAHDEFLRMMKTPEIVAIVECLVGGEASGIGGEFFYMRPGTPGFVNHQDNMYVQAPADEFLSAWTALTDVRAETGALAFFPGSHKLGLLPTRERETTFHEGQNPGARAVECVCPPGLPLLNVEVKAGTTVFFHSQLVHGSNTNSSEADFRYSFLATYIRKGMPFRSGTVQRRVEIDLHN